MTGPAALAARRAAAAASQAEKGPPQPLQIFVYGNYEDPIFQMLKAAAEYLAAEKEGVSATVEGFFQTQYEQHQRYIIDKYGGSFSQSERGAALVYVETDGEVLFFANQMDFVEWAGHKWKYEDNTLLSEYESMGLAAVQAVKGGSGKSYCAVSVSINGGPKEKVELELFNEETPNLAANFIKLLADPKFNGHPVHRVKAGCWVQAGDLVDGSGMNSAAVGGTSLTSESFRFSHDRPGLLGMCSHGKDTIGSQFYVTLRELPFLDRKFCIIGRVISGMDTIVKISGVETKNERPVQDVKIFAEQ